MPSPWWIRVIVVGTAITWIAVAALTNEPVGHNYLRAMGYAASGLVIAAMMFDAWLWRFLPQWVVRVPNLRGTWRAEIEYENESGARGKKDCFIVVRQTFSTIGVDMLFDISTSVSRSATIIEKDGSYRIWFSYFSQAGTLEQEGNAPHRGGSELLVERPGLRLSGDYWTERFTHGHVATSGRSKTLHNSFRSACADEYPA